MFLFSVFELFELLPYSVKDLEMIYAWSIRINEILNLIIILSLY